MTGEGELLLAETVLRVPAANTARTGANGQDRTADLLFTKQLLYH